MWANLTIESKVEYKEVTLPRLAKDGSNKKDFFLPDVVGNQRFAANYGGHPRSDIALINEQNDIKAAQYMLEQLQDYSSGNVNSGLTDAQILAAHKSKYCQTASEQISYLEGELNRLSIEREKQVSKPDQEGSISFSDKDVVDNV